MPITYFTKKSLQGGQFIKMNKYDKAIKRFETCRYSDGIKYCIRPKDSKSKLLNFFRRNYKKDIGFNSESISSHCGRCGYYDYYKPLK